MKQNKLVIVVLVVIAVLFVLGLSSGVFRDKEKNDDALTMSKAQFYKERWVASINGALSPMGDKLKLGRMIVPAECKADGQSFKLTRQTPSCDITIKVKKRASVQKAVLSIKTDRVRTRVSYPDDQPCAPAAAVSTRGTLASGNKFKKLKLNPNLGEIKPGRVKGGDTGALQALTLDVIYTPRGKSEQSKRCVVTGDIDLAVLEKGGTLRLECKGCQDDKSIVVALE
jgi:hypothetical protein